MVIYLLTVLVKLLSTHNIAFNVHLTPQFYLIQVTNLGHQVIQVNRNDPISKLIPIQ